MGDYIIRDYVERNFALDVVKRTSRDYAAAWVEIAHAPAADVAPVVHGRWELKETVHFGLKEYKCSECSDDEYWKKYYCRGNETHCPNCGAKMDKEDANQ